MDLPSANQALIQLTSPDGLRVGEVATLSIVDVQIRKVREQCESGMARNERCRSTRRHGDPSAFICSPIKGVETLTPSSLALTANDFREHSSCGHRINRACHDVTDKVSAHTLRHTFALNYLRQNPGKLVDLSAQSREARLDCIYTRACREELPADLKRSRLPEKTT
jgi:integrase